MIREAVLSGAVLVAGLLVWILDEDRIDRPPGVLVPSAPIQQSTASQPITLENHRLTPLADYRISARVVHSRRYTSDDLSAISPVDLALGWQAMSDSRTLQPLKISQFNRFVWISTPGPLPGPTVMNTIANVHIIPADPDVRKAVLALVPGDLVTLTGQLVQIRAPNGAVWRSSLSRTDSGPGGCEILYVTKVQPYAASARPS